MEKAIRVAVLFSRCKGIINTIGRESVKNPFLRLGDRMESKGLKKKNSLTILGQQVTIAPCIECSCGTTRFPGDEALDSEYYTFPRSASDDVPQEVNAPSKRQKRT